MASTDTLDLFIVTFNAGKKQVNTSIFGQHVHGAFARNGPGLPDLVVICLQEMAPLAKAFIGSYMIGPFFQCYEVSVNTAAAAFVAGQDPASRPKPPFYTVIATRNVGMTGIVLLARDPSVVHGLQSSEVGFGAGDMANKGAVGLRMLFARDSQSTELTFVSTHLAAMEWNLDKRNKNWESIVSGLVFEDPRNLIGDPSARPTSRDGDDEETESLLSHKNALHNISIYKPSSHLFVGGDLNYRISKTSPNVDSAFPDLQPGSPNYYPRFLAQDQLKAEKDAGRTLHGLTEAGIEFPPTYKLSIKKDDSSPNPTWKYASHRWPSWCDRILYLETPGWAGKDKTKITVLGYDALPPMKTSDHQPVFLRLTVPILEPAQLIPPDGIDAANSQDPRIKLPYTIDLQAWEHRAQVKKWEFLIGWSMLASQSKQGIGAFVAVFLIGLGTWWFRSQ
ncbi:DNase I-like protein [Xylariaceae sp. FL0255]|nr:DNase I-like protein [Xylariaceae sp. FL0255]